MKIYIMTDMEGCAGMVNHDDWVMPDGRFYDLGRELLTKEINAAVEGFFTAGATKIDVLDGHGAGGINPVLLDSRVRYVRILTGYPFMPDNDGYDAIAWVGQHAKAGTQKAHIAHTGWFNVLDMRINGISVGEFGTEVFIAAEYGITPIFASGDLALTIEAQALVPGIETVAVKNGLTEKDGASCDCDAYRKHNLSAAHIHPERARTLIREGAERALKRYAANPASFAATKINPPYVKETDYRKNGDTPAYSARATHPDSVVSLMNTAEVKQ